MADLLPTLLDDLLAAATTALTADGSGVTGAPDRTYVSHGPPAADCTDGQLTVHTPGVRFETDRVNRCYVQPVYLLVVTLFRCVPAISSSGIPSQAKLDESAMGLAHDGAALIRLIDVCESGGLFPTAPTVGCTMVTWSPGLAPVAPSGQVAGWTLGLEVRP